MQKPAPALPPAYQPCALTSTLFYVPGFRNCSISSRNIHILNKQFHFLKSVVSRGILNFTGVRKLTSDPHNSVLPGCHHSKVTPFTTSLNDILQLRFTLQPIPHPAKATADPRATQFRTAGLSPSFCKARFGSYRYSSQHLSFPLSFPQMTFCLPTQEEENGDSDHTAIAYVTETCYGSRGNRNNAYPSRAGVSVFHNTK